MWGGEGAGGAAAVAAALGGVVEPRGRAGHDREREIERDARAVRAGLREQAAHVLPVHVLHREVVDAVLLPDLEHLRDVLVVERGREPRLVEEHLHGRDVVRALGRDQLEHDVALERADAGGAPDVDACHPACRERRQDLVLAETRG